MEIQERAFQIAQAIINYLNNDLNEAERKERDAWLAAHEDNRRLWEELKDEAEVSSNARQH